MAGKKTDPKNQKVLWDLLNKAKSLEDIAKALNRNSITKTTVKTNLLDYCLDNNLTMKNLKARLNRIGVPKPKKKEKNKPKVKKEYARINASGSVSIPASIIKAKGINLSEEAIKYVRYDVRVTKKTGKINLSPEIDMVKVEKNYGANVDVDDIKKLLLNKLTGNNLPPKDDE